MADASDAIETVRRLEAAGAEALWVVYHNYSALSQGKAVPRDRFADVARGGVSFARANWDFAITDDQVPHPSFGADTGDFRVVPDPGTVVPVVHHPGVCQAFGWLVEMDGRPWAGDPRARLQDQADLLAARGLSVAMAFETEFVLAVEASDGDWTPADRDRMFVIDAVDARWAWVSRVLAEAEAAGIPVHQFAKEYGPGQYELSILPSDPVASVDRFLLLRQLVKALAREDGLVATFMPKPWAELPANGVHLHVSLSDDDGRQVLQDPDDPSKLSELGAGAVAGLLGHADGLCALTTPTPNSYRRLAPGSWAPAHRCWGFGNRAALVRIPGTGMARHLEYRLADASANPYLLATGILAALVDGMDSRPGLPAPAEIDVGHLDDATAAAAGFDRLPSDVSTAIAALQADPVLLEAVGPVVAEHYPVVKQFEAELAAEADRAMPGAGLAWERRAYLEAV